MKSYKRIVCLFLIIALLLAALPVTAFAAPLTGETSGTAALGGTFGDGLSWSIENGLLRISGEGDMPDYDWYLDGESCEYVDSPWYPYRDEIISVSVEEGVTSIGANAFAGCTQIAQKQIAASVTQIGAGAFDGCALSEVDATAESQDSRVSLLGEDASMVRYAVLLLDTSGSMGSKPMAAQKAAAIRFCESILKADGENYVAIVSFGSSVNTVRAFTDDIEELRSAVNGLRGSGNTNTIGAVNRANELLSVLPDNVSKSVVICSDGLPNTGATSASGPFTSADYSSYKYANAVYQAVEPMKSKYDIFALGFFHSLSGSSLEFGRKFMRSIQNVTYYEVTNPEDLEFTFDEVAGDITTPGGSGIRITILKENEYLFYVVDEKGNGLENAKITFGSQSGYTDASGMLALDAFSVGNPEITVSLKGYVTWTNADSNWEKSPNRFETITLYPVGMGELMLKECRYSNLSNMTSATDLLHQTKTVSLGNNANLTGDLDFGIFYLACQATETAKVKRYELWQGDNKIAECSNGTFGAVSADDFEEGGDCFIRVVSQEGTQVDTQINLQFKKEPVNAKTEFSLDSDKVSIKLGDEVPYLGGSTVDFKLPIKSKLVFSMSDDGEKMQLGFNLALNDDPEKTLNEAKEFLSNLPKASNLNVGKMTPSQKKLFESLKDSTNKAKLFKDVEVDFVGYAEADIGSDVFKGYLMFQFDANIAEFGFTTWVIWVPLTVQAKFSLEGGVGAEASYNWSTSTLEGNIQLNVEPKLTAFGGVGVGKLIGAGVYGSAKLDIQWNLIGTPSGLQLVDLTGELGMKAYLGWLEASKAFAYNTWHLYTANSARASLMGTAEEGISLLNADTYTVQDLGYLSQESQWQGSGAMLLDAAASTTLSTLLTETYRNAQPTLLAADNGIYGAFLKADADTGDVGVVVTRYSGGSWATPVAADAASVMDGAPVLCLGEDGTIWMAYSRTGEEAVKTDLLSYANHQSIVVGTIDPQTLAFTEEAVYEGNGYAYLYDLCLVDGTPTLVWADAQVTDADSVIWPTNATLYAAGGAAGWSQVQTLTVVESPVLQLAAGNRGDELAVAYTVDMDGSADTMDDLTLYCLAGDNRNILAEHVTGKVSFATLPGGEADFVWNDENSLKSASGTDIPAVGITDEYAVTGSRIYYSAATDTGASLASIILESGDWSAPVFLTECDDRYLEDLSVVTWQGQDYLLAMNTDATITGTGVEDSKDLVWSLVQPTSDLKLEDISYDAERIHAGDAEMPVTLYVTNAGDHTVTSVEIIRDGINSTASCEIAPGETAEVTAEIPVPTAVTAHNFTIVETGTSLEDEYHQADNHYTLTVGYADLAIDLVEQKIGETRMLVAYVTNEGVAPASGTVVFQDQDGNKIGEKAFAAVSPGDVVVAKRTIQSTGLFTATVISDEEDLFAYNDTDTVYNVPIERETQPGYAVTLDPNGGTLNGGYTIRTAEDGTLATLPAAPSRSGYIFRGWYTAASGGERITTSYVFQKSAVIYAQWDSAQTRPSSMYRIVISASEGGQVKADNVQAEEGETVNLTVTPETGYKLERLTVENARGDNVAIREAGENRYVFTMPASQVTISAVFSKKENNAVQFTDVLPGAYYYEAVRWAVSEGITEGTGAGKFSPDASCTRGQMVTFLWRAAGSPAVDDVSCKFTDVPSDAYYYEAVLWAVDQGITNGTSATTFSPDRTVTRAQTVMFLYRYAGQQPVQAGNQFTDVPTDAEYADAVSWAVAEGVTTGTGATSFSPEQPCTRAQIVTFFHRLFLA